MLIILRRDRLPAAHLCQVCPASNSSTRCGAARGQTTAGSWCPRRTGRWLRGPAGAGAGARGRGSHRQRPRLQGGCCRSEGSLDLPSERSKSPVKLRSSSSYTLISGERKHNLQKLNSNMLENQSLENLFFG